MRSWHWIHSSGCKFRTVLVCWLNASRWFSCGHRDAIQLFILSQSTFYSQTLIHLKDSTVGISPNSPAINTQTRTLSAAAAAEKAPPSLLKVCGLFNLAFLLLHHVFFVFNAQTAYGHTRDPGKHTCYWHALARSVGYCVMALLVHSKWPPFSHSLSSKRNASQKR